MPTILDPNQSGASAVIDQNVQYNYPKGLNLRPDSREHGELLARLNTRILESSTEIARRHPSWRKIDRTLTAYVPGEEWDKMKRDDEDSEHKRPISLVIPYSFATLETLQTYFVAAFLNGTIFSYGGNSPEDRIGAILLEKVIDIQAKKAKMALALHTAYRDSWAYGMGAAAPYWDKVMGKKTVLKDDGFFSAIFGKFMQTGQKRVSEDAILYEGNFLRTVDPYLLLPDPNVAIQDIQNGEFIGWIEPTNYMKILERERIDKSYFNGRFLAGMMGSAGRSQYNKIADTGRNDRSGMLDRSLFQSNTPSSTSPVDQVFMYANIIPEVWKVGPGKYPEKWLFCVASDRYILCAKPLGLNHNMYPIAIASPDFDGYSTSPLSRLEIVHGLQDTLDWLVSSHITNVRKAINDMLIVDPSLINVNDLRDPAPGKLIRMRRAAWGRGVENAVKQLAVTDITQNHIKDSVYITELIKTCSGSVDSVMGLARQGSERISAEESRGTRMAALSRLSKAAKVVSMQFMSSLGYMLASHTQQLMSKEQYISITGEWEEELKAQYGDVSRVKVSPFDLVVDYDVSEGDGTIATGESADVMVQLFQTICSQPMLQGSFDVVRIFQRIAEDLGWKDVNEFKAKGGMPPVQSTVLPDQKVQDEAQKGNLIPMGGR